MNDQVILSVTKKNGGLEIATRGTGREQLGAIEGAAAATWKVMAAVRNMPEKMATDLILAAVKEGIENAAKQIKNMGNDMDRSGK